MNIKKIYCIIQYIAVYFFISVAEYEGRITLYDGGLRFNKVTRATPETMTVRFLAMVDMMRRPSNSQSLVNLSSKKVILQRLLF